MHTEYAALCKNSYRHFYDLKFCVFPDRARTSICLYNVGRRWLYGRPRKGWQFAEWLDRMAIINKCGYDDNDDDGCTITALFTIRHSFAQNKKLKSVLSNAERWLRALWLLSEQQFAYSVSKGRHITNYALYSVALLKTTVHNVCRAVFIISHNISLVQSEADEWLDSSWNLFCWTFSKAFLICAT